MVAVEQVLVVWLAAMGLVIGSFLNVVIARVPKDESVVRPRSRCPRCGHQLPWYENIPVISWLALRGRCSSCKAPISPRYIVVELITGTLFMAALARFGWSGELAVALLFICVLIPLVVIDAETYHLEGVIMYPAIPAVVLARLIADGVPGLLGGLTGVVVGFLVFRAMEILGWVATGKEALGAGDKYLLALAGAAMGPRPLIGVVMLASIQGAVFGLVQIARTGRAGPQLERGDPPDGAPAGEGAASPGEEGPGERLPWTPRFLAPGLPWWKRLALVPVALLFQDVPDPPPPGADGEEPQWVPGATNMPFGPWIGLAALEVLLAGPAIAALLAHTPFGLVAELLFTAGSGAGS